MTRLRVAVAAVGVLAGLYGAWLAVGLGWGDLRPAVVWLVGGVLVHDALLAPLTIAVWFVAARVVRLRRLTPWVVGLVLLAPVTLLGVPVLGRFGARPDNPSLLDRHYWLGWAIMVVVVVAAVAVATLLRDRTGGGRRGQGAGRR